MNQHLQSVVEKKMERTAQALRKHQFDAHVIHGREELVAKIKELMPKGSSCTMGGAMTMEETGVMELLRGGDYDFRDRQAPGADVAKIYFEAFDCDVYLSSANAITEAGEIYNMDGRGNRVAAFAYGPKKVIVVAGYNKIVKDLDAARKRNQEIAAPANAARVGSKAPCVTTGKCEDCGSPTRICCSELISRFCNVPGRISVLLLDECCGY